MEFIVTFIAGKNTHLDNGFAESMAQALAVQGIRTGKHVWRKEGTAMEMVAHADAWPAAIHCPPSIDCIIQPSPKPRYRLLIADMDSTMITCECIDELADFIGRKAEIAAITERAMNGELDFAAALAERVTLLAGLSESVLQQCYDERVKPTPGAKELLAVHKKASGTSVLVSGGFTFFTSRVANLLGFDEHRGNTLEVKNGKLTGRVIPPVLGKEAKLETLQESCRKLGISTKEVLAIGDGANDLPMLLAAGLGVAYHAKPLVQEKAKARINHGNLSSIILLLA